MMVTFLVSSSLAFAQDQKLPEPLRHVPPDAMGFVHLRVGEFLKSDLGKNLLQELKLDKEAAKGLKKMEQELGIDIADIDTVTVLMLNTPNQFQMRPRFRERFDWDVPKMKVMPAQKIFEDKKIEDKKVPDAKDAKDSPVVFQEVQFLPVPREDFDRDFMDYPSFSGPLVIVSAKKDLDRRALLRMQFAQPRQGDPFQPAHPFGPSVLFLSDRIAMVGQAWDLAHYSEMMARNPAPKNKPLASSLALATDSHVVVAGGYLPAEMRKLFLTPFMFGPDMRSLASVTPLLQTEMGAAIDLGKQLEVKLNFTATSEVAAAHTLQAVKSLRVLAEIAIEKENEAGEPVGTKLALQKRLKDTLANAVVEQKGMSVRVQLKMALDATLVKRYTKEIVGTFRQRGDRTQSVNNLKQIGLALHSFHDVNKRFPPAGISNLNDPNGKPLLSWRVAILPYIDQAPLYKEFDLSESWDHPTNKKLIAKMPAIYVVPGTDNKEGETNYRVLVGPTTVFELRPGNRGGSMVEITDGTSNTIMVVEAAEPAIWTKPDDLPFNPNGPLPKFGTSPDGFHALFGDGTVRYYSAKTPDNVLRALITRNGGEVVPIDP
jgi:hypothetical protein